MSQLRAVPQSFQAQAIRLRLFRVRCIQPVQSLLTAVHRATGSLRVRYGYSRRLSMTVSWSRKSGNNGHRKLSPQESLQSQAAGDLSDRRSEERRVGKEVRCERERYD